MRMWMVDPKIMCRQHLLGEHVEHHMFVGAINKGVSMAGYLRDELLEPASLHLRHEELVAEITRRGYNHKSPLPKVERAFPIEQAFATIDRDKALLELLRRCPECRKRAAELTGKP